MKHLQHGYILTILWFHQVTLPVCWCWNSHEATMLSFPNRLGIFTGRSSFLKPSPPQRSSLPLYSSLKNEQEVAKAALLKVLKRQRVELQETERLLEELSALEVINSTTTSTQIQSLDKEDYGTATYADRDSYPNGTDFSSARTRVKDVPTIAQSMLAGVDYGFVSRSEGCSRNYEYNNEESTFVGDMGPPGNVFSLGSQQFMRNLNAMVGEYKDEENMALTAKQKQLQTELKKLTLNSTEIWEREKSRGPIVAPWVIKGPYYILCYILDVAFEHSYVPSRFFLLETVARMPYFTYITMLHLYETLGFWRRSADIKRIHFAEEWNEFHHLLIMESIGGDQAWWVRFTAQHSAIVYFFVLSLLWSVSPSLSYKFSELLETHAVDTYGTFIDENEDLLKQLPPSLAATDYYTIGVVDPMFGEYQTTSNGNVSLVNGNLLRSLYGRITLDFPPFG